MPESTRLFLLNERPRGPLGPDTLALVERDRPVPGPGEALVRTLYLSIDPTNRTWMDPVDGYLPALALGDPMRGIACGEVIVSESDGLPVGALVSGMLGFAEHAIVRREDVTVLPPGADPKLALGPLGHIGATAYFGLTEVGRPKAGETVLVSAAAGATGSLVAQIAKHLGCRVIGTAGSDAKCAWLRDELGLDGAINYRREPLAEAIRALAPEGIDVFWDNVGGPLLDEALRQLALRGRVVLCGGISQYNASSPAGPGAYLNLIRQRGRMEGFIVLDYLPRMAEAHAVLLPWIETGKLRFAWHEVPGLEHAPDALRVLFSGQHTGKVVVKVAEVSR